MGGSKTINVMAMAKTASKNANARSALLSLASSLIFFISSSVCFMTTSPLRFFDQEAGILLFFGFIHHLIHLLIKGISILIVIIIMQNAAREM